MEPCIYFLNIRKNNEQDTTLSFKLDSDYSIIVTISDLEDNKFDVSWDKIKDSEFKMFEL